MENNEEPKDFGIDTPTVVDYGGRDTYVFMGTGVDLLIDNSLVDKFNTFAVKAEESLDAREHTVLNDIPKEMRGHICPSCGEPYPIRPNGYEVAGVHYPIIHHECFAGMDGEYPQWEEVHCCSVCNTLYHNKNVRY